MPSGTCPTAGGGVVLVNTAASVLLGGPSHGHGRALLLPHRPAAVPVARREFVTDVAERLAAENGDDEAVISEAAVVVSELLGNAVRHAPALPDGRVLVCWEVQGHVVDVEVTDGGGLTVVRPGPESTSATDGRGLRLVGSLAHEWGVQTEPDGCRTVWAAVGGPSRRRHRR